MKSHGALLGLAGLAGLAALASADPTWPSSVDELEEIMFQLQSFRARKFSDTISPCANEASGPGRQNAAEWLRVGFHDMSTANTFFGTGGADASLQYELDDGENTGPGHATTLAFMAPYLSPRSSLADLIALGVSLSVRSCGGPVVPVRAGRVDAAAKGNPGVPQPQNSAFTFQQQFERMGFSVEEMIQVTACGHTLGGVHNTEFPDLVPAGAGQNGEVGLDASVAAFDNKVVTEYLAGTTTNPLVVGPSVNVNKNSDFKVFNIDGNQTMEALADSARFMAVCRTVLQKMIDVVPAGVALTDPIVPYALKPVAMQLTLAAGGNTLHLSGYIRIRTTGLPNGAIQGITLRYKDRQGAAAPAAAAVAANVSGISQGFDDTFAWFPIAADIPAATGISSFTVDVKAANGTTTTYDNNGVGGYPLRDAVLFQQPQSCVLGSSGKLTVVAAVRNDRVAQGAQARVWSKTPQTNSPVPRLANTTVALAKGDCVGQYTLFSVDHTIEGGLAYQGYVDVINGDQEDSFKALSGVGGTCGDFASPAACKPPSGNSTTSSTSSAPPTSVPTSGSSTSTPTSGSSTLTPTSGSSTLTPTSGSSTTTSSTPPQPTHKQSVGGYTRLSCWTEGEGVRALNGISYANDSMTLESCKNYCSSYVYWGTEYGRECYCGNTLDKSSSEAPTADCSMVCAGDGSEFCGAGNRLELFSTTATQAPAPTGTLAPKPTVSPFALVGCWTEGDGERALGQAATSSSTMTNEACGAFCKGFKYFGTEYGSECYCGTFLADSSKAAPAADCSMPCAGDALQYCGASNRLELYMDAGAAGGAPEQPPAVGAFVLAGCRTEGNGTRALSGAATAGTDMTNAACAAFCAGFAYFGTEYGDECYCGNGLDASSATAPAGDCRMLCGGDELEYCGGSNRLSVYARKNSTARR